MATLALADVSAALTILLMQPMTDQFRRDVPILSLLSVTTGKGANCNWKAKFEARTAGGAYAEGADMADGDFDSHDRAQAVLNWGQYRKGAKVSGLNVAAHASEGGEIMDEEIRDAIDDLAKDLGTDVYAGDPAASPVELAGAALAIDSAAGTFAGLASSTYADWLGNESSLADADLSVSNLRAELLRPIKDSCGRNPDFITCDGALFDRMLDVLGDKAETIQIVNTVRGKVDIAQAAGARALSIDGVALVEDRHCTASTFYGWSSRDVEIVQLPAAAPKIDPAGIAAAIKEMTGADVNVDDVNQALAALRQPGALRPAIEFLSKTGDSYKAQVKVYAQMKWKRRNSHGKLTIT
jgi:hypothetical protein